MSEDKNLPFGAANAAEAVETWTEIAQLSQKLVEDFVKRQAGGEVPGPKLEEMTLLARPFQTWAERLATSPESFLNAQAQFWQDTARLWQQMGLKAMGAEVEPVASPERGDRRFRDSQWEQIPAFDFIKQSYLLASRFIGESLPKVEGPGDVRAKQLEFYTRQFIDAMSPSNFAATNPAVLRETMESGGQNLVKGLRNVLEDLERGKGQLRTKMVDQDAFEVGKKLGFARPPA